MITVCWNWGKLATEPNFIQLIQAAQHEIRARLYVHQNIQGIIHFEKANATNTAPLRRAPIASGRWIRGGDHIAVFRSFDRAKIQR